MWCALRWRVKRATRASETEEGPHFLPKTQWLARNPCDRWKTDAGGSQQEGGTSRAMQVDRHVAG